MTRLQTWYLSRSEFENAERKRRLQQWAARTATASLTAHERKKSLQEGRRFEDALALAAVRGYRLDGVITLEPDRFAGENILAAPPLQLRRLIEQKKVSQVPLVAPADGYHEVWEKLEKEMALMQEQGWQVPQGTAQSRFPKGRA